MRTTTITSTAVSYAVAAVAAATSSRVVGAFAPPSSVRTFVVPPNIASTSTATAAAATSRTTLHAAPPRLTERQLQFWEDVDDGLNDVAAAYPDQSLDRIRTFASSARGDVPPPVPEAEGHRPSEEHVEGLTASPFWEVDAEGGDGTKCFPWAEELEEKSDVIREEFAMRLKEAEEGGGGGGMFAGDSAWQNKVMGEGWSAVRLQRLGEWNTENCAKFPRTYELLRSLRIPLAVRGVCFARQLPGSGVAPHTDGRNFILTSHLGLNVPMTTAAEEDAEAEEGAEEGAAAAGDDEKKKREGPWITVGTETRTWTRGKLLTLDTSFEHSTGNPSLTETRDVLIIDFWHPELTEAERAGLEFVYDLRNKFERGEVPVRRPRSVLEREREESKGGGLGGLWKSLTGGGE